MTELGVPNMDPVLAEGNISDPVIFERGLDMRGKLLIPIPFIGFMAAALFRPLMLGNACNGESPCGFVICIAPIGNSANSGRF